MNVDLLISGSSVLASQNKTFQRLNPYNNEVASVVAAGSPEDAIAVVRAAHGAFPAWSAKGPHERRKLLLKAADLMEQRSGDFIAATTEETGATGPWGSFNVAVAAKMLREAASMTTQITGEIIPSEKPGSMAMAVRQAVGVCVGIAPWNAPVILGTRAIATPLACGNTVVLKASEMCPRTHRMIGEVLNDAGIPAGVVNVITNAPEDAARVVEALVRAPEVKRVNFTGSTRVGRIIAKLCAEELKPCLLELGGKAPFIVLDDADVEAAVNGAAFGAFMNMGQICMSTERIIVVESIADQFTKALAEKADKLPAGDPNGPNVLGALVSLEAALKMDAIIADALDKGAKIVAGGRRNGAVVEATVLDHVTPAMRIYSEESFGPVKPIIRVKDVEEAVAIANDTEYGLAASLYTNDVTAGLRIAARIKSGICHINGPTVADEPQMPFGGVKESGWGRFGGKAAISEFTDLRWITIEDPKQGYPF
ncbi:MULTISPECIES: aldehyde dehydrogenase [Agrobacterium tumefaciens complex]|uniref:aldehyde dehydrogenase n=1 Tax=Agrobacterium tumefaciens complex TaxID=1183400 RepID=UPI0011F31824|nr:aldehyde dehydrogenase [Agrobacterium tumefaciens]KAA1233940.1 aldehyde dehydrogenase [Agrobacterium tumefaciens]MCW8059158.1 aldehyde dehydrogenase [Agrobacterium tumefaciens]MCW8147267.1 aldehyde dehydrogenase [Agrobacterium tumefaciens]MQB37543.1 aldehyde dehydrogenase family protein [Agrobacterium tumefaciens]NSX87454.1 aldehyde dehydrogenase [Agrobacterium tumefaciens]